MKKFFLTVLACTAAFAAMAQDIVPLPLSAERRPGRYVFASRPVLDLKGGSGDITFVTDPSMKEEAYRMKVAPEGITVTSRDHKGAFYAMQSLRMMLGPGYEDGSERKYSVPAMEIYDEPRFGYRGFMLDVARYFTPKDELLKLIDCMALLKLNRLHLHLTDDNGWRIEIRRYPLLHEVGSRRVDRTGEYFSERLNARQGEPTVEGGYYTQEDIREIVSYAAERQIEVIPEIDMPAHSNAALAAYPMYACPVVDKYIGVLPGLGGNHADIIYCAGNDKVYEFLEDVLDEVMEIFPSKVIHLGGDEAWKTHWKKCPLCQARMREEGLKDEEDLQGYFMSRMAEYVRSKGREVAGWDDLSNSEIPEDAILYGWQGYGQAAVDAAKLGHRFVMTPARITYLIRYQGPQWFEPRTYFGNNRLYDIYSYEPVKDDWTPDMEDLLLGVQASLWTEFCNSPADVQYLAFPRLAALAEIGWSAGDARDWDGFLPRLDRYVEHIGRLGVESARSMFNIQHAVTPCDGSLQVSLECERTDVQIRYTLDGTVPDRRSGLYRKPFAVSSDVKVMAATFKEGEMCSKVLELPLSWNKATACGISGKGANDVLVNGVRGSLFKSDFEWVEHPADGKNDIVVDLGEECGFSMISVGCINDFGMAAHLPAKVEFSVSRDGRTFEKAGTWTLPEEMAFAKGTFIHDAAITSDGLFRARYVRIKVFGQGMTPAQHCRPDNPARVYLDEVIIR